MSNDINNRTNRSIKCGSIAPAAISNHRGECGKYLNKTSRVLWPWFGSRRLSHMAGMESCRGRIMQRAPWLLLLFMSVVTWSAFEPHLAAATRSAAPCGGPVQDQDTDWSGFGPAEAQSLIDRPVLAPDDERIIRLFYRIQKLGDNRMAEIFSPIHELGWLASSVGRVQFQLVTIEANVVRANRLFPSPVISQDIPQYFQLQIQDAQGNSAAIFALHCPSHWLDKTDLNEPIRCQAFFLGSAQLDETSRPLLIFVAKRVQWIPRETDVAQLDPGRRSLAQAGFNLALLSEIEAQNRRPMSAVEAYAFEQMLAAATHLAEKNRAAPQPSRETGRPADLLDLIRQPQQRTGDSVLLRGRVVRALPIYDTKFPSIIGTLEPVYYQVELSIPLGDRKVSIDFDNGERLLFEKHFPCTVVIPKPLGDPTSFTKSNVEVGGIMYRFWNYESGFSKQQGVQSGQIAPMVMATSLTIIPGPIAAWDFIPWLIWGMILAFGFLVWYTRPKKRRLRKMAQPSFTIK